MWNYEHAVETAATAQAVWRLYSEIEEWTRWDQGLERISLDGPFAVGSRGEMVVAGQPPRSFELTEVRLDEAFTSEATIPGVATIRVRHTLHPLPLSGTRIVHAVEVEGSAAEELGPRLVADMPAAMDTLARLAPLEPVRDFGRRHEPIDAASG